MSLRTHYRQMGGRRLYSYQPGLQMVFGIGQSLELGLNATIAERAELSFANRTAIKMLSGMTATDGGAPVAAWLHGPGTRTYTATHATAIIPADVSANAPAALTLSLGIDAWRRHFGRQLTRIVTGTVAIAGQSAEEMDDDDPVVTGILGPRMINNLERLLQEGLWLAPAAVPLLLDICQGEADVDLTMSQYQDMLGLAIADLRARIASVTGVSAPVLLWQTGGYRNSLGDPYGSTLAQVALARANGVFGGPIYPSLLHDNVHADLNAQKLFSEVGAYNWVRHEMGADVDMTPMAPTVIGEQMVVPIRTDGRALAFDAVAKYAAYGGLADHGVEVSGTTVSDVALSGNLLIITAAAPLSLRTVSYAMQAQDRSGALYQDGAGKGYAGHRGDIMEAGPANSYLVPGSLLKRFIPSFRIAA